MKRKKKKRMEGVSHRSVKVNGINMHVAEKGDEAGPVILFIHGFPELWYTWRHQIESLASKGFRAVAPDMRGYGGTDAPPHPEEYTCLHVVGDLVALIDHVAGPGEKVFVVGHDWGAMIAWYLCLFRPERVKALVNLSVAYNPRNPNMKPLHALNALYGPHYYVNRFQEAGEIEGEFAKIGTERVLKEFYTYRKPGPLMMPKGKGFGESSESAKELPRWQSQKDIDYFVSNFGKNGFTGGLNYYRNIDRNWELMAPWTGAQINVPVKFIVGDLDLSYNGVGIKDYIHKGGFKRDVPFLHEVVVMENVGHFINEEKHDEINQHIFDFFAKFQKRSFQEHIYYAMKGISQYFFNYR